VKTGTVKNFPKFFFIAFLTIWLIPGTQAQQQNTDPSDGVIQSTIRGIDYRIGPEDVLSISVWRNEDLTMDVPVRPDGMISFPLIDDIEAQGLTTLELRDIITEKLKEYVTVLDVTVIVSQINSYKAFILGEVRTPGVYEIRSNTTLLQLIAMAGGLSEFASPNKLILLRLDENNQERKIKVKLKDAMNGSDMSQNRVLQPMDTVIVN
jgi:polysaccharide export outer membrane protein